MNPANHPTGPTEAVLNYLRVWFPIPETLLRGMAQYHLWLSGSRAAEFHVPGSCRETSDFDFYTHYDAQCIGGSMRLLQDQGVIWDDPFDVLRTLLDAQRPTVMSISRDKLYRMVYMPTNSSHAKEIVTLLPTLRDYLQEGGSRSVSIGEQGILNIGPERRTHGEYGHSISIVTGHTTFHERKKVQLIFAKNRTPLDHIMAFYGSHVQCAITAYGTFHLYYQKATDRGSYIWPNNSQHPDSVRAAMQKYKERGWQFDSKAGNTDRTVFRSLANAPVDGSRSEMFNIPLPLPREVERERRDALQHLVWREGGGRTEALISRGNTNTARCEQESDAGEREEWAKNCDMIRRYHLGRIAGSEVHPDRIPLL